MNLSVGVLSDKGSCCYLSISRKINSYSRLLSTSTDDPGTSLDISVAPEIIHGQGYSYSCEWWSLGLNACMVVFMRLCFVIV